ncbi:MAPEG family protein [Shewanella sp. 38A_GOM-205m]|uniref:MAPEG family protein n=1 Tax=Shewanella sp. 38A_GOM-205m TaxID=1380363 RepID=UPI00048C9A0D|nr:MAPEG family protein [Shewanella sp. 38A_GOM-205m]
MSLFISGFYAALTGLLVLALAYRVARLRRAYKIGLGDGGNDALHLANRVHGNLLENAPIALLLLVLAEANGMVGVWLHLLGTIWLVARLLHAIGLTQGKGGYHPGRFLGTLFTWISILVLALFNLWQYVGRLLL